MAKGCCFLSHDRLPITLVLIAIVLANNIINISAGRYLKFSLQYTVSQKYHNITKYRDIFKGAHLTIGNSNIKIKKPERKIKKPRRKLKNKKN